jgi:hypothetical protein
LFIIELFNTSFFFIVSTFFFKSLFSFSRRTIFSCNSTINCFRKRNLNNSKIDCLNHISKKNKGNYDYNKRQIIRNSILNLSKKELKTDNYSTNCNINAPTNEEKNMSMQNINKYAYDKKNKIRRKIIEVSKDNDDNHINLNHQQLNNFSKDYGRFIDIKRFSIPIISTISAGNPHF